MARMKETELASKLIAWLQSQGHKHLHEEVKVSGVGTADVVSCDSYITVYECKIGKQVDLLKQCDRWLGLAHAVYAVSNQEWSITTNSIGLITVSGNSLHRYPPTYRHDYNAEPIRAACNKHNAVGGSFAKAGSQGGERATKSNIAAASLRRQAEISPVRLSDATRITGIGISKLIKMFRNDGFVGMEIKNIGGLSYVVPRDTI